MVYNFPGAISPPYFIQKVGNIYKFRQTLLAAFSIQTNAMGYSKALDAEEKRFALSGLSIQT